MRQDGAELVTKVCRKLKYNRSQLADVLGVKPVVINNWENSIAKPPQSAVMIMNIMLGNKVRLKPRLTKKSMVNRGKTSIGKRLENGRLKLALTIKEWAEELGVTRDQYYHVLKYKTDSYNWLENEMYKVMEEV
jgi:DNA-binding XRE family transcriptional regulator